MPNPDTNPSIRCPECGATWQGDRTCQDDFYQMLYWESDEPVNGEVHHLMVLSYHLQHPSLYTQAGLEGAIRLLHQFMDEDIPPHIIRQRIRADVDSGKRRWKITGKKDSHGTYEHPVNWAMTVVDIIEGGISAYRQNVHIWAQSILHSLRTSGNA